MEERLPILPPPPPARVALWAMLNLLWFRMVRGVGRRWRETARIVQHTPHPAGARGSGAQRGSAPPHPDRSACPDGNASPRDRVGALAPEGRASARLGRRTVERLWRTPRGSRPQGAGDDRATTVEGRLRPSRAGQGP